MSMQCCKQDSWPLDVYAVVFTACLGKSLSPPTLILRTGMSVHASWRMLPGEGTVGRESHTASQLHPPRWPWALGVVLSMHISEARP